MAQQIEVVYENGVLRPLGPLPEELHESERYIVTVETPGNGGGLLDAVALAYAVRHADPTVTLEEVRKILSKVPGTGAEAVAAERGER